MNENVVKISPTAIELCSPLQLLCPEENCSEIFTNPSNLSLHLIKHHEKKDISLKQEKKIIKQFYCPVTNCLYNSNLKATAPRFFASLKYLKQHYVKMHAEKCFKCDKCNKAFPSKIMQVSHHKICGQKFTCHECGWNYNSKEALQTHARRKKHTYSSQPQTDREKIKEHIFLQPQLKIPKKIPNILPKATAKTIQVNSILCDQSIQTENAIKLKRKIVKRKLSQTTQTFDRPTEKIQKHNETQTFVASNIKTNETSTTTDSLNVDEKDSFEQFEIWKRNQNSSGTQTSPTKYKNNIHLFDESENENSNLIDNSSQTQNNLNNMNYFEDSVSCFGSSTFDTELCSIETQTDSKTLYVMDSNMDQLDQMFSSNMYTQTCDEILSEFGLSDIQTQTNWDYSDLLVSTETQTSFSQCLLENSSIQTQTIKPSDNLLNVISSGSHSSIHTQT